MNDINPLDFKDFLFVTEVGSRMWGMADVSSDHDMFCCYLTPASEYLRTGNFHPNRPSKTGVMVDGAEYDFQYMEIGHLVGLLKKGNVNAIWAVCSGIVHKESPILTQLKFITRSQMSKATYHSIEGMAISQMGDAIKAEKIPDEKLAAKKWMTAMRTLEFGDTLFRGGGVSFSSVRCEVSKSDLNKSFERFKDAYATTRLKDTPNSISFEDFLKNVRLKEILSHAEVGVEI